MICKCWHMHEYNFYLMCLINIIVINNYKSWNCQLNYHKSTITQLTTKKNDELVSVNKGQSWSNYKTLKYVENNFLRCSHVSHFKVKSLSYPSFWSIKHKHTGAFLEFKTTLLHAWPFLVYLFNTWNINFNSTKYYYLWSIFKVKQKTPHSN